MLVFSLKKVRFYVYKGKKNLVFFVFFGGKNFEKKIFMKLSIRFKISNKNDTFEYKFISWK